MSQAGMKHIRKSDIHNEIVDLFIASGLTASEAYQVTIGLVLNFAATANWSQEKFDHLMDSLKPIYGKMEKNQ